MKRLALIAPSVLSFCFASAASAAIVIDGSYDADYGAAKSTVTYDSTAPDSNFATPTGQSNTTSYSIYLADEDGSYYGFLKSSTVTGLAFANLYFDLDPQNNNGSDLGFEVTNSRAFIPGGDGTYAPIPGLQFVISADGTGIEFVVPNSVFTAPIAGLNYYPGQEFASTGSDVVLRLSQSFGYSVAGGAAYGTDRLGALELVGPAAVPEPETLALLGLGVIGLAVSRRLPGRPLASLG